MIQRLRHPLDILAGRRSLDGRHLIDKRQMTPAWCPTCGARVYLNRFGMAFTEHGIPHTCQAAKHG